QVSKRALFSPRVVVKMLRQGERDRQLHEFRRLKLKTSDLYPAMRSSDRFAQDKHRQESDNTEDVCSVCIPFVVLVIDGGHDDGHTRTEPQPVDLLDVQLATHAA